MSALDSLRALARYQTHGGYVWAMVADDGACICTPCVRENYRQIFCSTRDSHANGWQCVGLANSGESDSGESCSNCNKELWEDAE